MSTKTYLHQLYTIPLPSDPPSMHTIMGDPGSSELLDAKVWGESVAEPAGDPLCIPQLMNLPPAAPIIPLAGIREKTIVK